MKNEKNDLAKQRFVFFVTDVDDVARGVVKVLIAELSTSREWSLNPPRLLDETGVSEPGSMDAALDTLGGELELFSAIGNPDLSRGLDAANFAEVMSVIDAVCAVSERHDLSFDFELDGLFVGAVEGGIADKVLQLGLIDPWYENLFGGLR